MRSQAEKLAQAGCVTGASGRNWASYGEGVVLPDGLPEWRKALLTDPQTSGGLLIACAEDRAEDILATIVAEGYASARIIGRAVEGDPEIRIV